MGNCMGDYPTAGDYARSTTKENRRLIKELALQVAELRRQVAKLTSVAESPFSQEPNDGG